MSDAPWIQVNYSRSPAKEGKDIQAILIGLHVPPHQIPQAVRSYRLGASERAVIEFRYADDEDFRLERQDERVWLRLGKRSSRLLGLELDTAGITASQVKLTFHLVEKIEQAVQKLVQAEVIDVKRENYSLAMQAIEAKKSLLSSELVHA